jgi:hypothetical protein
LELVLSNMNNIYLFIKENKIDINKFEHILDEEFLNRYN